jgi:hypothetical protein
LPEGQHFRHRGIAEQQGQQGGQAFVDRLHFFLFKVKAATEAQTVAKRWEKGMRFYN